MSLIHKYGKNKENNYIKNQLIHGIDAEVIARTAEVPLSRVKAIERSINKKNIKISKKEQI